MLWTLLAPEMTNISLRSTTTHYQGHACMCLRITAKHAPPPSDAPSSVASTKYTNKPLGNKQFFALMNMNRNFAGQDLLHLGMRSMTAL